MKSHKHSIGLLVGLVGLAVIVPLLLTPQMPTVDDPISARLGDTTTAQLTRNAASLYYDDAFYYLRIAEHVAAGAGSTFDGLHPTNGYHPLWLLCLLPLAWWFPEPMHLLLASFGLQMLLGVWTTLLVYRTARLWLSRLASAMAVLVWLRIQCTYWMSWAGMEYGLQALVVIGLLLTFLRLRRRQSSSGLHYLWLGVLGSLAFLARLDNLLLVVLVGWALLWPSRASSSTASSSNASARWQSLMLYLAPVAVVVMAYVGLNQGLFGHPWPVSGELKGVWSVELLAEDPNVSRYGLLGAKAIYLFSPLWHLSRSFAVALLLGAFGGVAWVAISRRQPGRVDLWPLAVFSLVQYLTYATIYHGGFSFQPWYFVAQHLLAALIAATVFDWVLDWVDRVKSLRRWKPWGVAMAVVLILFSTAVNLARRRDRQVGYSEEPLYVTAGWVDRNLPADVTLGAWNAGIVSFFSRRQVVNLDGLVNAHSFARTDRDDLCAYLDREGISFLVDVFDDQRPFAQYEAQIGHCASRLERIWTGPGYPQSPRRAMAFRWLGADEGTS